jgi:hypothetical protein
MESSTGRVADTSSHSPEGDRGGAAHTNSANATVSTETVGKSANGSPVASPPYWYGHGRTVSNASYHSIGPSRPVPITLEDHSEEGNELSEGCWAKSATIDEYVLVSGPTGIGAYVVWHCTVETLKGGHMTIRKR